MRIHTECDTLTNGNLARLSGRAAVLFRGAASVFASVTSLGAAALVLATAGSDALAQEGFGSFRYME